MDESDFSKLYLKLHPKWLYQQPHPGQSGLKSLKTRIQMRYRSYPIAVTAKRKLDNKVSEETRYFLSSLSANHSGKLEHAVQAHWAIENNLH